MTKNEMSVADFKALSKATKPKKKVKVEQTKCLGKSCKFGKDQMVEVSKPPYREISFETFCVISDNRCPYVTRLCPNYKFKESEKMGKLSGE